MNGKKALQIGSNRLLEVKAKLADAWFTLGLGAAAEESPNLSATCTIVAEPTKRKERFIIL